MINEFQITEIIAGGILEIDGLRIGLSERTDTQMFVTGYTNYLFEENITKSIARSELEMIIQDFNQMINESIPLRYFLTDKVIEYNLAISDEKSAVGICRKIGNQITWLMPLRE